MKAEQELGSDQPDYVARLNLNIPWLAKRNGMSLKRVTGVADVAQETMRKWLRGIGSPTLTKLAAIGDALGVDATDLLLPHDELVAKVESEGLRPFVLRPDGNRSSLASSRSSSGATSKMGGTRTLHILVDDQEELDAA